MNRSSFTKIAQNCSEFDPKADMFKNSPDASGPTCLNCKHFKHNMCNKNLIDPIKARLDK
jgi:hypothetical protein